ncbi:cysteine hydrolase family protein [Candidatus Trichorickettsia mobilis]|uniref:cysteine hydrolase family protein n=1 Tax=Candidatus Trichorickettsia mobilis TaxID=1346319 RepID=UPI0029309987|nr:isochorismatase family cysteine hydrolase [Candidatus Trichorickettsia mobilis]
MINTAFIGLDYIVDITEEGGKIASSAAHAAERNCIDNANKALHIARKKGWLTILVKVGFSLHYYEQPKNSPMFSKVHISNALALEGKGTNFHSALDVQPTDLVIIKPRVSAFYGTMLEAALRANKINRLVMAGVSSVWAVQSTVRDAHDRDYEVYVLEDACAAINEKMHQTSMEMLSIIAKIIHIPDMTNL